MLPFTSYKTTVDVGVVQQKKAELAEIVENTSRNEQAMSELKASDADLRQQHESLTQERVCGI
jgi:hypothetical protein